MLSRNVGIELPLYTTWNHRRAQLLICIAAEAWSHSTENLTQFYALKKKVNCTLVQALRLCTGRTAHRASRGITLPFLDQGTKGGEGSPSHLSRSLPPEKTRYPLYKRLGGPQGRSGQVRKISPPPEFFFVQWFYCSIQSMSYICLADGQLGIQ
jgi:hypothetical protein